MVTIEDTHELIPQFPTHTPLVVRQNVELKDLCTYSLRLRPDRVVLGEIRGGEIVPFFMAMNTGHQGLMCTIHANSARDSLKRAALLFSLFSPGESMSMEEVTKLICQNIDYVVFLKEKSIHEIVKVHGADGLEPMVTSIQTPL